MIKLSRTDAEAFAAWKARMDKLHAASRKSLDETAECLERMRVRREAAERRDRRYAVVIWTLLVIAMLGALARFAYPYGFDIGLPGA